MLWAHPTFEGFIVSRANFNLFIDICQASINFPSFFLMSEPIIFTQLLHLGFKWSFTPAGIKKHSGGPRPADSQTDDGERQHQHPLSFPPWWLINLSGPRHHCSTRVCVSAHVRRIILTPYVCLHRGRWHFLWTSIPHCWTFLCPFPATPPPATLTDCLVSQ